MSGCYGDINTGCPKHGMEFLSVTFNDLTDKIVERCTVRNCNFEQAHFDRRKKSIKIDFDDRRK